MFGIHLNINYSYYLYKLEKGISSKWEEGLSKIFEVVITINNCFSSLYYYEKYVLITEKNNAQAYAEGNTSFVSENGLLLFRLIEVFI